MATFIDVTLLEGFQALFVFLLVWAVTYGVLSYTQPFGKENRQGLYAFIGLFIALLTLFSSRVLEVIAIAAPWFVAAMFFCVFLLLVLFALGYKTEDVHATLTGEKWSNIIVTWGIVIAVIIVLGSTGQVFFSEEQEARQTQEVTAPISTAPGEIAGTGPDAFFATVFHPRVLGMIIVLMVGFLAIIFLAKGGPK